MSNETLKKGKKMKRYFVIPDYFGNKTYSFPTRKQAEEYRKKYDNSASIEIFDSKIFVYWGGDYGGGGSEYFDNISEKEDIFNSIITDALAEELDIEDCEEKFEFAWKQFLEKGVGIFHYSDSERVYIEWRKKNELLPLR